MIYDADKCIGCRFCMIACPFGIPKYEWSKAFPLVRKCTGCYSRIKEGLEPACAAACPTAISYGNRDEILKEAERRMKTKPERYFKKIYGKDEAGGTAPVFYLTHQPLDELKFQAGHQPGSACLPGMPCAWYRPLLTVGGTTGPFLVQPSQRAVAS